jgi:hypothetical protein
MVNFGTWGIQSDVLGTYGGTSSAAHHTPASKAYRCQRSSRGRCVLRKRKHCLCQGLTAMHSLSALNPVFISNVITTRPFDSVQELRNRKGHHCSSPSQSICAGRLLVPGRPRSRIGSTVIWILKHCFLLEDSIALSLSICFDRS